MMIITPQTDTVPATLLNTVAPTFDSSKAPVKNTVKKQANSTNTAVRSAALVTTETTSHKLDASAGDWERRAMDLQRVMWKITDIKALAGCHRWRAPGANAVGAVWRGAKSGRFMGLQDSHSVWGSPMAALKIIRTRRNEVMHAVKEWFEQGQQHTVVFLTATLRHKAEQGLDVLWDALAECWSAATSGSGAWNGNKRYEGDKRRFGVKHWVKSVEVTHGSNGWHPHMHVLLFLKRPLSDDELAALKARFYVRWARKAQQLGLEAPNVARGVDVQQLKHGDNPSDLAGYLTKGMVSGLSAESTAGALKQARGGNRTPFQVLETMANGLAVDGRFSPRDVALWREWERVSQGRRFMAWSKGAKNALGVLDMDDAAAADLAEREDDGDDARLVGAITPESWKLIASDIDKRLQVQHSLAAEHVETARKQFAAVCTELGLEYHLLDAPVTYEGMDAISRLDSALGRPEVRNEANPPGAAEMYREHVRERALAIADMYREYTQGREHEHALELDAGYLPGMR